LLRHALDRGFSRESIDTASPCRLVEPEELDVIKAIAEFPSVLNNVARYVEPHRITAYLEDLSAAFHRFYQKHRIVTDDNGLSLSRLMLTAGVQAALQQGLELLGVSAPERM
jgi:arginyl-tRNA synthetase